MIHPLNALCLAALTAQLLSGEVYSTECDPCCAPDPCSKCAQIWPTCGPNWTITPNAGPCVADGFDANASLSFIYWTAREDNLGFGYLEELETVRGQTSIASQSFVQHPGWGFHPGFKVGVGYLYDHDGWDIAGEYTWLRVRDGASSICLDDPTTQRITGIWPFSILATDPSLVQASWELDFNAIDVELGRNFFISHCLKLRPHFGLKGSWQDQCYAVEGIDDGGNLLSDFSLDRHRLDYWGVGIRAGLDTTWHVTYCISIPCKLACALLWERFEIEEKAESVFPIGEDRVRELWIENAIRTIKPVIELYLGLRWETWFCCEHYHFSIEAGWEEQWWSGQNQLFDAFQESRLGDLSLHGFTLKARIDF